MTSNGVAAKNRFLLERMFIFRLNRLAQECAQISLGPAGTLPEGETADGTKFFEYRIPVLIEHFKALKEMFDSNDNDTLVSAFQKTTRSSKESSEKRVAQIRELLEGFVGEIPETDEYGKFNFQNDPEIFEGFKHYLETFCDEYLKAARIKTETVRVGHYL